MPKMTVAQKREFLVEMCNCREYLKTDVELNKAVLKKHLKFLPQQKLYKFRACIEREFRMLEENCIWMSLASSFPDPFDHTINIDLVKNRREVKEWLGKNGSSLCFEVVKRLFEEKGLAIPYTFSDFEDYMKTCLDENGIPIKDRERAFLAAHATPDELSQMDSIIQQLVCARKRFASIEEQMTKMLFEIIDQVRRETREISIQEAQTYVDEFLQMVEKYMTVEDVDSAVITRILSKHGGLWQKCNDIAYNKWIADHANEVNTAQEELAALQHKVAQAENDVSSAKEKHGDILREVAEAQDDLCRLQAEIARYKILEKETVAAIREKIAGAQKNVAGFIADLSILLPQATSNESGWKYRHISAVYPEDEVGVSKDWKDELNELSQNLSYSLNVEPDLATMLAAFLYSAHIHNAPILIAGPCGQDIANALSVSLYADNAGQLMFGEQFDCDIADAVNNVNEHIVAAQNMFGKGWGDIIPQMLANSRKHIVWTHPYVEDLAIEPQGLYNYMLPVISECFVGTVSSLEPYAGKRSEDFIGYVPKDTHPLRIAAFKKLGISKALLRQLSRVISDAKVMVDSPERAKDMEMLFGVMPICVLTGQLDVMREVLEAESGISSAVKAEAERYLKDE